jgi:hypothetical protein
MYLVFPTCFGLFSHHHWYNLKPKNSGNMDTEKTKTCIHNLPELICEHLFTSIQFLWILTEQHVPYMWSCFLSLTAVTLWGCVRNITFVSLNVFLMQSKYISLVEPIVLQNGIPEDGQEGWHVGVIKYICDTWMCTSLVVSLDNLAKICRFNYFINPITTTIKWPSLFQ